MNHEQIALLNNLIDMLKIVLPSLFTMLVAWRGANLAYQYTIKQIKYKNHKDFIKKQITEFYSPMLGYKKRIRASGELRVELGHASGEAWRKLCERQPQPFLDSDKYYSPFKKMIDYENEKFPKDLLPLYDKMEKLFTENYWLANSDTKEYYGPFCRYVELWHRDYDGAIPNEVHDIVKIEEEPLNPFYENLETTLEQLTAEISNKKV